MYDGLPETCLTAHADRDRSVHVLRANEYNACIILSSNTPFAMLPLLLTSLALSASFRAACAIESSPSGNYTPSFVNCPTNVTFVRPATEGLSTAETEWLSKRRSNVITALEDYLGLVDIPGFDTKSYIKALQANESGAPFSV